MSCVCDEVLDPRGGQGFVFVDGAGAVGGESAEMQQSVFVDIEARRKEEGM